MTTHFDPVTSLSTLLERRRQQATPSAYIRELNAFSGTVSMQSSQFMKASVETMRGLSFIDCLATAVKNNVANHFLADFEDSVHRTVATFREGDDTNPVGKAAKRAALVGPKAFSHLQKYLIQERGRALQVFEEANHREALEPGAVKAAVQQWVTEVSEKLMDGTVKVRMRASSAADRASQIDDLVQFHLEHELLDADRKPILASIEKERHEVVVEKHLAFALDLKYKLATEPEVFNVFKEPKPSAVTRPKGKA